MTRFSFFLSTAFFLCSSLSVYSQVNISESDRLTCGTAILHNQRLAENPELQDLMDEQNTFAKEYANTHSSTSTNKAGVISYTIPVVYHIIHNNGPENISKAAIEASVANLNEDFQKLNLDLSQVIPSFTGITADVEIQFRLAHIDPTGNCTEGITRTVSTETYAMTENAKFLVNWNTTKYLNIWVGQTMASGSGGWSYYPGTAPSQNQEGIVVRSAQIENTITHEVGHCFGLLHTFQSGCGNNCSNSGDRVCDTPPVSASTQSCDINQNSCSNDANGPDPYGANVLDQIENYMSYNSCQNMFSLGQSDVMEFYLNSTSTSTGLAQYSTSTNLTNTGVANPYNPAICVPIADFTYNKEYVCEGGAVTFTDDSYNATPTLWNWTFTGGSPSTSGINNPIIIYPTAGVYSVTHRPGTSAGSANVTKSSIITVSSLTADYVGPILDGFESTTQFSNEWWINNSSGIAWENNTSASTTGSRSVRIRNWFTNTDGLVDDLISPSYDISTSATKTLTFKQAYAKKTSADTDKLLVYYSLDCGATWLLRLPLTAAVLSTASDQGGIFVPSASDWTTRTIDLTSIGTATNVRFKFEFTSGGGNDLYLDDINIGGSVGIDDFKNIASFNVYPNPTNSSAQISFNLIKDVKDLSIKVRNAIGQEVTNVINGQSFAQGKYTLKIDEERKLSSGVYFVEFNADNNVKIQKLIVQ